MKFWFWLIVIITVVCFGCYKLKQYATANDPTKEVVQQIHKTQQMNSITRFHDDENHVTCWILEHGYMGSKAGISCIPDSQLR